MSKDVSLEPVTVDNWVRCSELKLKDEQEGTVASNLKTIAESAFQSHYELRAIKQGDRIVGMLAYCPEVDEPNCGLYWLFRLMVDKSYQNQGYGKKAITLAIMEMKQVGARTIRTMCRKENAIARRCYLDLGFIEIGYLDDGDLLLELGHNVDGSDANR